MRSTPKPRPPHGLAPQSLYCLISIVEHGLEPDCFLSYTEHPNLNSTSLLNILVRNYDAATRAAAAATAAAQAGGGGAGGGGGGGDLLTEARVTLEGAILALLEHGALVDERPRRNFMREFGV